MIARLHRMRGDDGGYAMVFTLAATMLVGMLAATTITVTGNNVRPAQQTVLNQAAHAAAQAGIQAFLAAVMANCTGIDSCSPASAGPVEINNANQTTSYSYELVNTPTKALDGFLRVKATGHVAFGAMSATRVLVADLKGGIDSNCFNYSGCSQYETQSPAMLQTLYPPRSIALSAAAASKANRLEGAATSVTWDGVKHNGQTGADESLSVDICNRLWYDSATATGTAAGRASIRGDRALPAFTDFGETGTAGGRSYTAYQACELTLTGNTQLVAPANPAEGEGGYYTTDAVLLSNSYPGGNGPLLNQPILTGWSDGKTPTPDGSRPYRSFITGQSPEVGGAPHASSTKLVKPAGGTIAPAELTATWDDDACVYFGPTRVRLEGTTATVLSPQTKQGMTGLSDPSCYPTANYTAGITMPFTLSLAGGRVIQTKDNGARPATTPVPSTSTGWPVVDVKAPIAAANSVFHLSGVVPVATPGAVSAVASDAGCAASGTGSYRAPTASAARTCAWSGVSPAPDAPVVGWTSIDSSESCSSTGLTAAKRRNFECEYSAGAGSAKTYADLRALVATDLAAATIPAVCGTNVTPAAATAAQLQCVIEQRVKLANAGTGNNARRYVVTATQALAAVNGTTNTVSARAPTADPMFEVAAGTSSSTTNQVKTTTFTVGRQVYGCYGTVNLLGICLGTEGWGNGQFLLGATGGSVSQFAVSITQSTWTTPTTGASSTARFPRTGDVTGYGVGAPAGTTGNGPGDLYVEGSVTSGSVTLAADNDVVVTGDLTAGAPNAAALLARNNVRVYHPVSCVETSAAALASTTAGFCPNDITGLYTGLLDDASRPDRQYSNLLATSGRTIEAAVFALGLADCVRAGQKDASGHCAGEFTVDNYNRGTALGRLTMTGTVHQVHHGAVGQEWEAPQTSPSTRPYSGYQLAIKFRNLDGKFAFLANTGGSGASANWSVVSVSAVSGG